MREGKRSSLKSVALTVYHLVTNGVAWHPASDNDELKDNIW